MKRMNARKTGTRFGARLLSLLLVACMIAGFGWTSFGTAYAADDDTTGQIVVNADDQTPVETEQEKQDNTSSNILGEETNVVGGGDTR